MSSTDAQNADDPEARTVIDSPSARHVSGIGSGRAVAQGDRATWARGHRACVDDLVRRRDWRGLRSYVAENWIAIWFSYPLGELPHVLEDVPHRALLDSTGGAALLVLALQREAAGMTAMRKLPPLVRAAANAVGNRSVGSVRTSFRRFRPLLAVLGKLQRENSRVQASNYPILLLQAGLSAVYAGEFRTADLWLAQAGQFASPDQAPFHRRDVAATRALLNAAFGRPAVAEAQLGLARQEPRTDSWVEQGVDAVIEVTSVALQMQRHDWTPPEDLLALPWWNLQPHWPAAVWVVSVGLLARGENERLDRLLSQLELSGLESPEQSGLFDSIFPTVRTLLSAAEGRTASPEIRDRLASHDDPLARLAQSADAVVRNRRDEALALASPSERAIDDTLTLGVKESIQASALVEAKRMGEAIDLLDETLARREAARALAPLFVPRNVAETIAAEPRLAHHADRVIAIGAREPVVDLTARERELFRLLLGDKNLRQIAAELGRTENTLKTHRRHLYRKLGVSSRDELRSRALRGSELWSGDGE
ncbi:hypothetical protein GCM10011490_16610 [Pseudoclavibacter endophyticus]|uniref:HTH luxR-type domain-containing protein n=1 Tax=Pseudoclavibacter endophyticus TaxID=1778590 RepID=A0A6H9WDE8_9MICO|nr:helix-turn-helix transcriptional regulator [Pseudoclavibacter endophyticus]KAB1648972.1 hypothetical protein F8O04_01375 [Pseudoclavibacter endophyticus]GGA66633.1 hypothetical protein GCM10011490_16610 [Pseudoclavibacter endophyticus]